MSDYWTDCIEEALEDAGITATKEQIENVVGWVEGAHENYGMAHGHDCIPNPMDAEIENLKRSHKKEVADLEERELIFKKSVANRRGLAGPHKVYIDNGEVCYDY